jgi:hypothetical protein
MSHPRGLPLREIDGFPEVERDKLTRLSVDTAEAFVSLTATQVGRERLLSHLGIDAAELDRLITLAKAAIPEEVRREMETPVDTSGYGLGALEPKDREKDKPA